MSNSLWPHGLQYARLPCPLPTPGVYSNSCSLSQWCHPTISSSVIPFSSCLQSFQTSGSFQMSQFLHQVAKVLECQPSKDYSGLISFRIDWFVPCSPRDPQESPQTPQFKSINYSVLRFLYSPILTSIHDYRKAILLTRWTFVSNIMSLLFNAFWIGHSFSSKE